nr:glycoside hydrolase family 127 protein [Streptomyces sp. SID12501]
MSRNWQRGDRITVSAPYRRRVERALDDPTVQSVFYGPVLLVARSQTTTRRCGAPEFTASRDTGSNGPLLVLDVLADGGQGCAAAGACEVGAGPEVSAP